MNINNIKHFLKILSLILAITFITDKILFYVLNRLSDKVYSGQTIGKVNHFFELKETTGVLIFGSSRSNHNIDPNKIDKSCFNMGVDGRNIAFVVSLIKTIKNKSRQTFLVQIDPEDLYSKTYKGEDVDMLIPQYHRNLIIKNEIDKLRLNNPFYDFFWSMTYNNKVIAIILQYLKPKYNYLNYNGYDPIYVDLNQKKIFTKLLSLKDKRNCQDNLILNTIYYNYLIELKEFANNNNKNLIFFTSPVYKDYCKTDNVELMKLSNKIKIDYYDFTEYFLSDNSLSYWKDERHLSNIGAEKFTSKINELISANTHQLNEKRIKEGSN